MPLATIQPLAACSLTTVLATLDELVDWERRDRACMQVDSEPARDLLARLGNPQRRFRTVHVAGTKGKGSVCALIDAGLRRAGQLTGRYASPHVERVNERIVLNGRDIDDEPLARNLLRALAVQREAGVDGSAGRHASWFDIWTVAAFATFAEHHVEWAVIECGIGGRCDSTNVIDSDVAVLTNVDLEHTALLGNTCEEIAREKLGILRAGRPLVTGIAPGTPIGCVVDQVTRAQGSNVVYAHAAPDESLQSCNVRIANAVLDVLDFPPLDRKTAQAVRLPGRLEIFDVALPDWGESAATVAVVLDGAHVASSLTAVLRDLRRHSRLHGPCTVVIGLGLDKDAARMLQALAPLETQGLSIVTTTSGRGAPQHLPARLAQMAQGCRFRASAVEQPCHALREALALARQGGPGGWVLVTGSLLLTGAVRPLLRELCTSSAGAAIELVS